jgi:hypothetical protein
VLLASSPANQIGVAARPLDTRRVFCLVDPSLCPLLSLHLGPDSDHNIIIAI